MLYVSCNDPYFEVQENFVKIKRRTSSKCHPLRELQILTSVNFLFNNSQQEENSQWPHSISRIGKKAQLRLVKKPQNQGLKRHPASTIIEFGSYTFSISFAVRMTIYNKNVYPLFHEFSTLKWIKHGNTVIYYKDRSSRNPFSSDVGCYNSLFPSDQCAWLRFLQGSRSQHTWDTIHLIILRDLQYSLTLLAY